MKRYVINMLIKLKNLKIIKSLVCKYEKYIEDSRNANILLLKSENIQVDLYKVCIVIDSEKYSSVEGIIRSILQESYINYNILVLYDDEEKVKRLKRVDDRIKCIEYENSIENQNICTNLEQINKVDSSEYVLYFSNINRIKVNFLKSAIRCIKKGYDINILNSKDDLLSYAIFLKKEKLKSFILKYQEMQVENLKDFKKYKNIKYKNYK